MVGALVLTALLLPAAAFADTCPPGQVGTPPYCAPAPPPPPPPPPAPQLSVKVKAQKNGSVKVTVTVAEAGAIKISGESIRTRSITAPQAGAFVARLRPRGEAKRQLQRAGRTARTQIAIAFTAASGGTATVTRVIRFRKKHPSR